MWKVGDIAPVSVLGVDGYPVTRARAEEAAAQIRSAIEVRPTPRMQVWTAANRPSVVAADLLPRPSTCPSRPVSSPVTASALQPPGNDLTYQFTLIVESLARLRSRSRIIDGEAVCCGDDGVPSFDRIRYRRHDASVFLCAFDLIELDGDDLRPETFETRKATLASLLKPLPLACG